MLEWGILFLGMMLVLWFAKNQSQHLGLEYAQQFKAGLNHPAKVKQGQHDGMTEMTDIPKSP